MNATVNAPHNLDLSDCVASPFQVGQRIRLEQSPDVTGIVTEATPHGFKYKLDTPQTVGRAAWGMTSSEGEVYSRSFYPHGGFEPIEILVVLDELAKAAAVDFIKAMGRTENRDVATGPADKLFSFLTDQFRAVINQATTSAKAENVILRDAVEKEIAYQLRGDSLLRKITDTLIDSGLQVEFPVNHAEKPTRGSLHDALSRTKSLEGLTVVEKKELARLRALDARFKELESGSVEGSYPWWIQKCSALQLELDVLKRAVSNDHP